MPTKLLTGLDILVVEDESLLRKQIAAHWESLGADVTGVGTLQAAKQSLAECGFDFAFCGEKESTMVVVSRCALGRARH